MDDERVAEYMAEMEPFLAKLDGVKAIMTRDMLRTFCWYSIMVDELTECIEQEGIMIDTPKGSRPNPANAVLHQYAQRKADYYQKCLKSLAEAGAEAVDKLAEFMR